MAEKYNHGRYQVEKVLTLQSVNLASAPYSVGSFVCHEDMEIVEIGLLVSTKISGTSAPTLILGEGTDVLGTITCPTDTAAGGLIRQTTGLSIAALSSGDTLTFRSSVTATISGQGNPYIIYRERYV